MDKYFKPIGDLVDTEKKNFPKNDVDATGYFYLAGDLDDVKPMLGDIPEESGFKPMGDLVDTEKKNFPKNDVDATGYFYPAGDLNKERIIEKNPVKNKFNITKNKEDINDYLLTVVSGKKYPAVCELGVLMSSGRMIIGLNELKKMVDEGYNIVSANLINADMDMIEVEFQGYVYDEELMEKRRRF